MLAGHLDRRDVLGQLPLWPLNEVEAHPTPLFKGSETPRLDRREVREDVVAARFGFDEAETLRVVESLDCAGGSASAPLCAAAFVTSVTFSRCAIDCQ